MERLSVSGLLVGAGYDFIDDFLDGTNDKVYIFSPRRDDYFMSEEMIDKTSHIDMLIFPGIFPVISSRNADFLHNEVPGISVPKELRDKLRSYEEVSDQRKAALDYTMELVENIAPSVDGLYLVSPLNKWDIALDFVRHVRQNAWQGSRRAEKYCIST